MDTTTAAPRPLPDLDPSHLTGPADETPQCGAAAPAAGTGVLIPAQRSPRCTVLYPAWLPVAPLRALVTAKGGFTRAAAWARVRTVTDAPAGPLVRWLPLDPAAVRRLERAYSRAERRGWVSLYAADELCVHLLSLHPANVWGPEWFTASEQADAVEAPTAAHDAGGPDGADDPAGGEVLPCSTATGPVQAAADCTRLPVPAS